MAPHRHHQGRRAHCEAGERYGAHKSQWRKTPSFSAETATENREFPVAKTALLCQCGIHHYYRYLGCNVSIASEASGLPSKKAPQGRGSERSERRGRSPLVVCEPLTSIGLSILPPGGL